jgi:outer membrane receptor for ferrienterochelin and colicins
VAVSKNINQAGRQCGYILASGALLIANPACAQEAAAPVIETAAPDSAAPAGNGNLEAQIEGGKQIYQAAAFSRFSPQTALDMVSQIPGFVITQSSGDRGLGEATQNILINGQRISGKSNDARTVLGRTPAQSVVRIEISDGAGLNIPGLSGQVLNLITKTGGLKGNFRWDSQVRSRVPTIILDGEINVSGKLGKGDFSLGLSAPGTFRGGGWGQEISTNGSGDLLYTIDKQGVFRADNPKIAASYNRSSEAGSKFTLNAEASIYRYRRRQEGLRFDAGSANPAVPDRTELGRGRENEKNYELSSDYEFGVAGGRLKIVGLRRFEHSPNQSIFRTDFSDGRPPEASQFNRSAYEAETIGRSEFSWKSGKADWSISAEAAYNYLDAKSQLFELTGGVFVPQALDNPNIRVTEKRGQIIASYGRPLSGVLALQAQVGGEYSELKQTGIGGLTRQFWRPKGQVSLAWKASPKLDVSAKIQRKVGQLNFFDFLASVDLQDGNNNAGNPDLVPPQSWLNEVQFNRKLGTAGSAKLILQYEKISDLVDQIPIASGGESVGNLRDNASRYSAETNVTLLFDPIGLKGAKLDLSGYLQKGRLIDPLTRISRRFGNERKWTWDVNFRHDIPSTSWAYGFGAEDRSDAPFYRLDYVAREYRNKPQTYLFVENKNVLGLKVTASLINLTSQREEYDEVFYTADRLDGRVAELRNGTNSYGLIGRLSISGTF